MRKCPYCAEEIQDEAIACRFCGRELNQTATVHPQVKSEKVFVNAGNIFVSNIRVQIAGTVYSLANITSVSVRSQSPSPLPAVAVFTFGACMAAGMFATFSDSPSIWMPLICSGSWFVGGIVGAFLLTRASRPTYILKVGSASGETNALTSKDLQSIQNLAKAINQAIIERG